ncbi:MAG: response regulator transcription factor [Terriglobales bacterium]
MNEILIVDDSPILRKKLRAFLELDSWEVCGEAENGEIAIEQVRKLKPAIVIMDLAMPVMNGLDAARRIASIAPETITVLFTMHDCRGLAREMKAAGIKDVLSKAEGPDKLLTSLKTLMQ